MSYQASDFLATLFGTPTAGDQSEAPGRDPAAIPEPAALATAAADIPDPSAPVVIRAELTPDGFRLICPTPELAAAIEAGRPALESLLVELDDEPEAAKSERLEWEDLPEADWNCPRCGGLLWWEDLRGGRHCSACEARKLQRSLDLADRAARVRRAAQPARGEAGPTAGTASRLAPCCEETTPDDGPKHVDRRRPVESKLGASAGCEDR